MRIKSVERRILTYRVRTIYKRIEYVVDM